MAAKVAIMSVVEVSFETAPAGILPGQQATKGLEFPSTRSPLPPVEWGRLAGVR